MECGSATIRAMTQQRWLRIVPIALDICSLLFLKHYTTRKLKNGSIINIKRKTLWTMKLPPFTVNGHHVTIEDVKDEDSVSLFVYTIEGGMQFVIKDYGGQIIISVCHNDERKEDAGSITHAENLEHAKLIADEMVRCITHEKFLAKRKEILKETKMALKK
jgi:hypothetical protein